MGDARQFTRRATLGLAAGAGLGAFGISPALFEDGTERPDSATVWPTYQGSTRRRLFAPVDPGLSPGSLAWEHEFPVSDDALVLQIDGLQIGPSNAYVVYPLDPGGRIYAFDRNDGSEQWVFPSSSTILGRKVTSHDIEGRKLTVFGDTVYVPISLEFVDNSSSRTFLVALETETGSVRWMSRLPYPPEVLPAVVLDDVVYVRSWDGVDQIQRYQPSTGLGWEGILSERQDVELLAAGPNSLFVAYYDDDRDGFVLGETSLDGSVSWTRSLPDHLRNLDRGTVAVTEDFALYGASKVTPGESPTIGSVRRQDGSRAWERTVSDADGSVEVGATESLAFVHFSDRTIAVDPESGDVRWDRTWDDANEFVFDPVCSPEYFYLPGTDGIYRRDPDTGRPKGSTLLEGYDVGQVAVVDDGLYAVAATERSNDAPPGRLLKIEP